MYSRPTTLLGLGLCLGQVIHMQEGVQPKPSLRAEPGPVVPWKRPVTFVCRGPAEAKVCLLEKDGRRVHHYQDSVPLNGSQGTEARFLFAVVSEDTAGSYRCFCLTQSGLSERSEPLQLQVTEEDSTLSSGPLPKPSLRAEPGPVVPRGRPVTFVCQGPAEAKACHLMKDGRRVHHYQDSVPQDGSQGTETRFLIPVVSEETAGRYRCFCLTQFSSSELSEPLQLQMTEEDSSTLPSGPLPKPSLRADPGSVIPRGRPVSFVCRGPVGAKSFRLEKDGRTVSPDQKGVSQDGSQGTEARFHFPSVSEDITGRYSCLYQHVFDIWSGLSESLELQVTEEDSTPPSGPWSLVPSGHQDRLKNEPLIKGDTELSSGGNRPLQGD
ncbi:immunoglobulin superfamily member 1-like [Myotis lucifugus]|uniref:immunoglobulin superfamily member 1-like n=1 Tax=Myotis lucifugus TaxID=59463 RepID=UPI000CCC1EC6|nr:immunoglobulin superfamily member 1-like [Myotis lucifugus]